MAYREGAVQVPATHVRYVFMGPGLECAYCHTGLNGCHPMGCPGERLGPEDTPEAAVERNRIVFWLRAYVASLDRVNWPLEAEHIKRIADRIDRNDLWRLSEDGSTPRP
jgi:hypothetical protein